MHGQPNLKVTTCCKHSYEYSDYIKFEEFRDQVSVYWLLKKDTAPRI